MTVGERIKELRTNLGLSQVDFADKINVSKQTLYKYENNIITNIPSDKIEAAARLGNVSPAYLMGWDSWDYAVKLISDEMQRISNQTNLYIQLFESYGYIITLKPDTVDLRTKSGKIYSFDRKDFMSMIQRCHKDILYNIERLIDEHGSATQPHTTHKSDNTFNTFSQENTPDFNMLAAHTRTDIKNSPENQQHDLDLMDDDSKWE